MDTSDHKDLLVTQVNCWDVFTFNTSTCSWDTLGSQVNCWDVFTFNTLLQDPIPTQVNCWDVHLITLIQIHVHRNVTTCSWDTSGSQDPIPTLEFSGDFLSLIILYVLG